MKPIKKSKISIVGLGALGSVVSKLLTKIGIGNLNLIDRDIIELNNMQRQILYNKKDVNKLKAIVAKEKLEKINSKIKIQSYAIDLNYKNIDKLLKNSDLILDCTDNLETRFLINDYCLKNKIPFIYAGVLADKGMLFNIIPNKPCFNCIFNNVITKETCDTAGVLNSIVNLIGNLQVSQAIKILTNKKYEENLVYINITKNEFMKIKVNKLNKCNVCNGNYDYLDGKKTEFIKLCGSNSFQFYNKNNLNLNELNKNLNKIEKTIFNKDFIIFKNLVIFKDRTLIKTNTEEKAKSIYSRFIGN